MNKSEGARGYMDKNTPLNQRHLLNMSLATRKETTEECLEVSRGELVKCGKKYGELDDKAVEHRAKHGFINERPHYVAWHRELIRYRDLKLQLAGIVAELEKKTGETKESMFYRCAKKLLIKDEFNRVSKYSQGQLNRLYETA